MNYDILQCNTYIYPEAISFGRKEGDRVRDRTDRMHPDDYKKHRESRSSECVEEANQLVSCFNNILPAMLKKLTSTLKGSNFVRGRVNWLGYDAIMHPSRYGKF